MKLKDKTLQSKLAKTVSFHQREAPEAVQQVNPAPEPPKQVAQVTKPTPAPAPSEPSKKEVKQDKPQQANTTAN